MTTNDITHTLSLNDVDRVLPPEFEILKSDDLRNAAPRALRAVRNESSARTHYFYSPQDYLKFVTSVSARQVLGEEYGTRYVLLSSEFDSDPYYHASITQTIAAFTPHDVVIHRLKSDETSSTHGASADEMTALITSYQSYLEDCEQADAQARSTPEFDPFVEVPDE